VSWKWVEARRGRRSPTAQNGTLSQSSIRVLRSADSVQRDRWFWRGQRRQDASRDTPRRAVTPSERWLFLCKKPERLMEEALGPNQPPETEKGPLGLANDEIGF